MLGHLRMKIKSGNEIKLVLKKLLQVFEESFQLVWAYALIKIVLWRFFYNVVPSYEETSFKPPSMVFISVIIHYTH